MLDTFKTWRLSEGTVCTANMYFALCGFITFYVTIDYTRRHH